MRSWNEYDDEGKPCSRRIVGFDGSPGLVVENPNASDDGSVQRTPSARQTPKN